MDGEDNQGGRGTPAFKHWPGNAAGLRSFGGPGRQRLPLQGRPPALNVSSLAARPEHMASRVFIPERVVPLLIFLLAPLCFCPPCRAAVRTELTTLKQLREK